jgi:3,4-dihydroxy 2-butanone 4-phosphate synthase/GTP cyclohydrolase II
MTLCSMEEGIKELQAGKMLIVVDDENRENEGDLLMAAEFVNSAAVNFMVTHARGLVCIPMEATRLDELNLPLMSNPEQWDGPAATAFTVSVDHKINTETGISAQDRAATVKALIDCDTVSTDFIKPGHLFPLRANPGGVLARAGHTEATIDLCKLSDLYPAGMICEIMNEDGTMSRMNDLETFSSQHDIKILSIAQIIAYRRGTENLINKVAEARMPTKYGEFKIIGYESTVEPGEHVALTIGEWKAGDEILTRVHSACLTGESLGSLRCDCGEQIEKSLELIGKEGRGVFLYMRQEGRGIGLHNKIKAYSLQDTGLDTIEANKKLGFDSDLRHYGIGAQILYDLNVTKLRLLTNNPQKIAGLSGFNLEVTERIPIQGSITEENLPYLDTKKEKMGHILDM